MAIGAAIAKLLGKQCTTVVHCFYYTDGESRVSKITLIFLDEGLEIFGQHGPQNASTFLSARNKIGIVVRCCCFGAVGKYLLATQIGFSIALEVREHGLLSKDGDESRV
jgi:hypothetical protein